MSRYTASTTVASEILDGEAIVIDLVSGAYFSFRGWTTWAWQAYLAGIESDEVDARFADVGGSGAFLTVLVEAGLLVDRDGVPPDSVPPTPEGPVTAPAYDRFDDMADMILLDPVHDVERDTGWPRPQVG